MCQGLIGPTGEGGRWVDEDDGAVVDVLLHVSGIELWEAVAVSENRRSVTVLPLHPPEVGGCVGLSGQGLVDEALFVVVRDVVAPPGEVPFVADRGRG